MRISDWSSDVCSSDLLLDEPTAGLAPMMVDEMFSTIRTISAAGTAVLMVEQNAKRALAYVDRGYVLENGHVRFDAPAGQLLANEDIGRLFLGGRNQAGRETAGHWTKFGRRTLKRPTTPLFIHKTEKGK